MGREAAADIDHLQIDISLGQQRKHLRGAGNCAVPLPEIGLLRTHVERHAIGVEAEVAGSAQQLDGHRRSAAKFA